MYSFVLHKFRCTLLILSRMSLKHAHEERSGRALDQGIVGSSLTGGTGLYP